MREITCNLHNHTCYSDGTGTYQTVADAAIKNNLDVVIVTDHNVRVDGIEAYRYHDGKKVLLLVGEEVHDQARDPQKNHTLVIGAGKEVAQYAYDPQVLLDEVQKSGGLSFLAHPFESELKFLHEPDISWVSWDVDHFTGMELWNGLSELKTVSHSVADAIFYGYLPEFIAHAPLQSTLEKWDSFLTNGKRIVAVGGSDAHALTIQIGPLRKTIFPYEFHFSAINNHLLIREPLNGSVEHDKELVYRALQTGSSFIGYDLPFSTRGFSFIIENQETKYSLGDTVNLTEGATAKVHLPQKATIRLIHNGKVLFEQNNADRLIYTISEPGYYRVECLISYLGQQRGWIYSNPIYADENKKKLI